MMCFPLGEATAKQIALREVETQSDQSITVNEGIRRMKPSELFLFLVQLSRIGHSCGPRSVFLKIPKFVKHRSKRMCSGRGNQNTGYPGPMLSLKIHLESVVPRLCWALVLSYVNLKSYILYSQRNLFILNTLNLGITGLNCS